MLLGNFLGPKGSPRSRSQWPILVLSLALLALCCGCRSLPALPPADLQQPGWTVHQGQAVWRPKRDAADIAGDLMVAVRPNQTFVQFTKTPFPMVIARNTADAWQIESPLQDRRYTGRGNPPQRILWFWLPKLMQGQAPPQSWSWERLPNHHFALSNHSTGESLEGYFNE